MAENQGAEALINATKSEPTSILGSAMSSEIHLGYLTNDTDRAIQRFESLGIGPWIDLGVNNAHVRGSFAFMTGRMFEICEPLRDTSPVFPQLKSEGFALSFHHVGTRMGDDPDPCTEAAKDAGMEFHRSRVTRSTIVVDAVFVDTRETLGHWLELLFPVQHTEPNHS